MSTQLYDSRAYRASQLAHHMRRLSEATAVAYHNPNVDASMPYLPSALSYPSSSSSSSSNSKGETSPLSNNSDRSENPLRTPSLPTFAPVPPYNATTAAMSNAYDQTYSVAGTDRPASDRLYANPMLYGAAPPKTDLFPSSSANPPAATTYLDPVFFMPAFGICQPSQGSSTVQLPQHTHTDMDPAPAPGPFYTGMTIKPPSTLSTPARHPDGPFAPFSAYSFEPSYSAQAYQPYASQAGSGSYGINPQALSLDMPQIPAESERSPTSATMFDEPLSFSLTPEWSPTFDVPHPRVPRASSLSPLPRTTQPQRPTLLGQSDNTSDRLAVRNPAGPAKKIRKRKSGWSIDANIEWEGVIDKKERRKMQNRMAQRAFRARMKAHKD